MAQNPISRPPDPAKVLISEEKAILLAREAANNGMTSEAPASAPIYARLMSRPNMERLAPDLGINWGANRSRPVWVVTVHADIETPGTVTRKPEVVHVYSVVIDAETGQITDMCMPCAVLG